MALPHSPPSFRTVGHLHKPSIQALIHGLNRHYYSLAIKYRKNALEEKMLMNLNRKGWASGLGSLPFEEQAEKNSEIMSGMLKLSKEYNDMIAEEEGKSASEFIVSRTGKLDPKRHLEQHVRGASRPPMRRG